MAVRCSYCGNDLTTDPLSHKEKPTAPSIHHLPAARLRICWLLEANRVKAAVPQLIPVVEHDEDLFVQRVAIEALAELEDARAAPLMRAPSRGENQFLKSMADKGLATLGAIKDSIL